MLKQGVLALLGVTIAGCSGGGTPSEKQIKQALYDYYATAPAAAQLQQALEKEVSVSDCRKTGNEYRCLIENKALGTSNPMFFTYDEGLGRWKFTKADTP